MPDADSAANGNTHYHQVKRLCHQTEMPIFETGAGPGSDCQMDEEEDFAEKSDSAGLKTPEEMSSIQSVIIRQRELRKTDLSTLKKVKSWLDKELNDRNERISNLRRDQLDSVEKQRRLFDEYQSEAQDEDRVSEVRLTSVHPLPIEQNEPSIEILPPYGHKESSELIPVKITQSDFLVESSQDLPETRKSMIDRVSRGTDLLAVKRAQSQACMPIVDRSGSMQPDVEATLQAKPAALLQLQTFSSQLP